MEIGHETHWDVSQYGDTSRSIYNYLDVKKTLFLDSGRSALLLLGEKLKDQKVMLPAYLCESIVRCFEPKKIVFYPVKTDFSPDLEFVEELIRKGGKVLYILNYFGKCLDEEAVSTLKKWKQQYEIQIIEDTTHSIFTAKNTVGDYCICSLRKWFPIPDGGVLYSDWELDFDMPRLNVKEPVKMIPMLLKNLYQSGKISSDDCVAQGFSESEELLDQQQDPGKISALSGELLKYLDVKKIAERRKANYEYLRECLQDTEYSPAVEMNEKNEIPFSYPISVECKQELRKYLAEKEIFCPVHWPIEKWIPNMPEPLLQDALKINERMMSIPIDQRYMEADMEQIVKALKEYDIRRVYI